MQIFVYEHLSGGGLINTRDVYDRNAPLLSEGVAMAAAVASDFSRIPGVEVRLLRDARLKNLPSPFHRADSVYNDSDRDSRFLEHAAHADGTLIIAPESDRVLTSLARQVERVGGRLLSPSSEFCEWASDKHVARRHLQAAGIPSPDGVFLELDSPWPTGFTLPAVLKPNDGCGSQSVRLITTQRDDFRTPVHRQWVLESHIDGQATSIALLRGSAGVFALPPCSQLLSDDGTFQYVGGRCPLPDPLARRAVALATRAASAMPRWVGYIGLDMVLGPAGDGTQDRVIEVNPRLTTSYVGVRALARSNLGQAMLDVAAGRVPQLSFQPGSVCFAKNGTVTPC